MWLDEARQAGIVAGPRQWTSRLADRRRGLQSRLERLEARGAEAVDDEDEVTGKVQAVRLRLAAASGLLSVTRDLVQACDSAPERGSWGLWADFFGSVAEALFDAETGAEARDAASRLQGLAVLGEEVELSEATAALRESLHRVQRALRPRGPGRCGRAHAARVARARLPHGRVHGARRGRVPVAGQAGSSAGRL